MQVVIKKQRALLKEIEKEVRKREEHFLSKSETWQDSITGDRYQVRTESLRALGEAIEECLLEF